jgi:hypothetical protein
MAALYIRIFHAKGDDPAGFIAMCIVTTFISIVIATAAAVFERTLQSAVDIKSENDLTVAGNYHKHRRHVGEAEDERHRTRRESRHQWQHFRLENGKAKAIRLSTLEAVAKLWRPAR